MDRRTYESHMDWEYQGNGPLDQTSPFVTAARSGPQQSVFGSPSKSNTFGRPNPFATPSKPVRSTPAPPQGSFAPQINSQATATPFRNPAFTSAFRTPQKRSENDGLSEASGAEDSPARTEISDFPNNTPETDRMGDAAMSGIGGAVTPGKIDKAFRYSKSGSNLRKHTPGRGEIKSHRDIGSNVTLRKRKRQNYDRDVSHGTRHRAQVWDESESGSEDDYRSHSQRMRRKPGRKGQPPSSMLASLFTFLGDNPNLPEVLHDWIKTTLRLVLFSGLLYVIYQVVAAIRSDIFNANESARLEIIGRITACQNEYTANGCATTVAPVLKSMCAEWQNCMDQNPEAIMRVKVTAKQLGDIINEFVDTMNYKAWGFFLTIILVALLGNSLAFGRYHADHPPPRFPSQPTSLGVQSPMPMPSSDDWTSTLHTPHRSSQHALLLDEGTDTDTTPPSIRQALPAPETPLSRRSPVKGYRTGSPVKYGRTPLRHY